MKAAAQLRIILFNFCSQHIPKFGNNICSLTPAPWDRPPVGSVSLGFRGALRLNTPGYCLICESDRNPDCHALNKLFSVREDFSFQFTFARFLLWYGGLVTRKRQLAERGRVLILISLH